VSTWQVAHHWVALAGWVIDAESGKAMAGVTVTINGMPSAFRKRLDLVCLKFGRDWDSMTERPDKVQTRTDGLFYFLDLPAGEYDLVASFPSAMKRYVEANCSYTVAKGSVRDAQVQPITIALHSTVVKGKITTSKQKTSVA